MTERAHWHERTVERSLKTARERAISRGDKFIKAAGELLRTTGRADFTVQEVVDRSGMSLRSFYHHFATKDDLLLGVIEEEVRRYITFIRPKLEAVGSPVEKLELMLTTSFGSHHEKIPGSRGMVLFHWNLAESRKEEFVATLAPQIALIREILEDGIADGSFTADLPVEIQASLLTHTLLSLLDMRVLGVELVDEQVTGDQLVTWCLAALGTKAT